MDSESFARLAYSVTSAALATDYSTRAIRKAIQDGDLAAYGHDRNGTRRIFHEDLVAWLKGTQQPSLHENSGNSIASDSWGSEGPE